MTKKCYSCVLVAIAEYNKENNETCTSVALPTENDILPTDTNPTDTNVVPPNGNNNTPTSTSVASPTDNNILPTDTSVAPPNENNITPPTMNKNITTDTIPTNVAPERDDFVPPKDIDIGGGAGGIVYEHRMDSVKIVEYLVLKLCSWERLLEQSLL